MHPVLSNPGTQGSGVDSGSAQSVPGVDRFAHFVVSRREDGELDRLGVGAMGITYRANDTQFDRLVALKTIHPQWVDDPEVRSRFAREARAAARLQHPNIASVLYQGEEASVCFYVMELVAGENLHHYIRRVGPLSAVHALRMAHQIALALVAASREGVIHRDLKPANVMVTSYHDGGEPHLKVIDFGLAKLAQDSPATFSTGGFLGTPEFASPEQCEEKPLDARSDLYSLGGVLWYLLTGSSPFTGSLLSVIRAQVSAQPAWEKLIGAPAPLLLILRRLMAKNRDFRPASPLEAAKEIEHAIEVLSQDPKNFRPIGEPSDTSWGVTASSKSAPGLGATAVEAPQAVPRETSNRWMLHAAISVCCFGGAIYGWKVSRDHQAAAQNAAAPKADAQAPVTQAGPPQATPATALPILSAPPSPAPAAQPEMAVAAKSPYPLTATGGPAPAFTNSLGMQFVHPAGSAVLAAMWKTRVRDFEAYASQSTMLTSIAMDPKQRSWRHPGFSQAGDHPVVCVSPPDAVAFCRWLTDREHKAGVLPAYEYYRLPTRLEWDQLFTGQTVMSAPPPPPPPPSPPPGRWQPGMPLPPNNAPAGNAGPAAAGYPAAAAPATYARGGAPGQTPFFWGTFAWPPPANFANYGAGAYSDGNASPTAGDGYAYTSPVGSYAPNVYGLYDMTGNAAEICVDGPPTATVYIRQGGSWASVAQTELRLHEVTPVRGDQRESTTGFRCIIARSQ